MDERLSLAEQAIDQQIAQIDFLMDRKQTSGQHFESFLSEEKTKLYGMLQIYWLLGGEWFKNYRN